MDLSFLKKITERFKKQEDPDPLLKHPRPFKDWQKILAGFIITLILIAVGHYALFWWFTDISNREIVTKPDLSTKVNRDQIKDTIGEFRRKEADFDNLINNRPKIQEPAK